MRVRLRAKRLSDAPRDYEWQADPEIAALDAREPVGLSYSLFEASYLDTILSSRLVLAVETLDGEHIGNCNLYDSLLLPGETEMGIVTGKEYWGKGYGSEAISLFRDYALGVVKLPRLFAKSLASNRRAIRAFEKAGFELDFRQVHGPNDFYVMRADGK